MTLSHAPHPNTSSPLLARRSSLADRVGKSFPPHAHVRGYAAWKEGRVSLETASDDAATAKVRGERMYDVAVTFAGGGVVASCACPARSLGVNGCKHVWATLLEIDHRGCCAAARASRGPLAIAFVEPQPPIAAKESSARRPKPRPASAEASAEASTATATKRQARKERDPTPQAKGGKALAKRRGAKPRR